MECINTIEGPEILNKNLEISTICYIADCMLIAIGTDMGRMYFWDLNRSVYLSNTYERFAKHKMSISSIKLAEESPKDKKLVFSSSDDGIIIVWEIECIQIREQKIRKPEEKLQINVTNDKKNKKLQMLLPTIETKSDLQLAYNHRYIPQIKSVINTTSFFKNVINFQDNSEKINTSPSYNQINVISYTHINKNYIYSGGNDGLVHIWDYQKSLLVNSLKGHTSGISCMTFDKFYLFTGSMDGQIFIWNIHDYSLVSTLGKSNANIIIHEVMMIEKFGILVSISSDKKTNFWKYESKELIKTINSKQECLCFNIVESYGKMICGTKEKIIWEFDLAEVLGENIKQHYKEFINNYAKDEKSSGINFIFNLNLDKDEDINNFKIIKCLI